MALPVYLAMTAADFSHSPVPPPRMAWMSCHFSPAGPGLSNLPEALLPGSVLMLDDSLPLQGHDPALVAATLGDLAERFSCAGILLDFQRPPTEDARQVVRRVTALPWPVGVSWEHWQGSGGVFLPPPPPDCPLERYLSPWRGQKIWLEAALSARRIEVTAQGAKATEVWPPEGVGRRLPGLHCRILQEAGPGWAAFTLWREPEDLDTLLNEAEKRGVKMALGLFQELGEG